MNLPFADQATVSEKKLVEYLLLFPSRERRPVVFWCTDRCNSRLFLWVLALVAVDDHAFDLPSQGARNLIGRQVTAFDCCSLGYNDQRPHPGLRVGLHGNPALVDIHPAPGRVRLRAGAMEQFGDERASRVIWPEAKRGPKEPFSAALRSAGVEKPTDLPRGMV